MKIFIAVAALVLLTAGVTFTPAQEYSTSCSGSAVQSTSCSGAASVTRSRLGSRLRSVRPVRTLLQRIATRRMSVACGG